MKLSSPFNIGLRGLALTCALSGLTSATWAQTTSISDNLTGTTSNYPWQALNGACLTAGSISSSSSSNIPGCSGLSYYSSNNPGSVLVGGTSGTLPDKPGYGALRLTNGDTKSNGSNGNAQTGAVLSNFTIPAAQGVAVSFTTVTYGGNAYGNGTGQASGADGISFFLMDGSYAATSGAGGDGGSLGYSCSNRNDKFNGVEGAYVGIGIDEFGNFANTGDNTHTGIGNASTGYPSYISVRGPGNINYQYLMADAASRKDSNGNLLDPNGASLAVLYPLSSTPNATGGNEQASIFATCRDAVYYNYSGGSVYIAHNKTTGNFTATPIVQNVTNTCPANSTCYPVGNQSATSESAAAVDYPNIANFQPTQTVDYTKVPVTSSEVGTKYTTYSASTISTNICTAQKYCLLNGKTISNCNCNCTAVAAGSTTTCTVKSPLQISNQEAVATPVRGNAIPLTYSLTINPSGSGCASGVTTCSAVSLQYAINGGSTQTLISSAAPQIIPQALPSTVRFGFAAGTGSGSNVHEITCFNAEQLSSSSSSAGANTQQTAQLATDTQFYFAYFNRINEWGQLQAYSLVADASSADGYTFSTATWDASCVLTGGTCTATGATNVAQTPSNRQILSWLPSTTTGGVSTAGTGIPFEAANLDSIEQSDLSPTGSTTLTYSDVVAYLRGDRSNEIGQSSGAKFFRARTSVLGDIVYSSPVWVGGPNYPYTGTWADAIHPSNTPAESNATTNYTAFKQNNANRLNVVYVGANDGLLHGFRAGGVASDGTFNSVLNDGKEVIAYMPYQALSTIYNSNTSALNFTSPLYAHNAFVDAAPGTGDLYYGKAWHTWLVGGLGDGGNQGGIIGSNGLTATSGQGSIYILDVTSPGSVASGTASSVTNSTFSESNAASLVVGEWLSNVSTSSNTSSTLAVTPISCSSGGTSSNFSGSSCSEAMGNTYGTPVIRRLHDGNWAVIFGNGFSSNLGTAGIFIMVVDPTSTTPSIKSIYYLDTGAGPSADPTGNGNSNGIAYVAPADLDGDHITDYVYAGDLFGNVWRFDLTSNSESDWLKTAPTKIFSNGGQPITTKLVLASVLPSTGPARLMVDFGTGRVYPQSLTASQNYYSYQASGSSSVGSEYLYGIWDYQLLDWNSKGSTQYATYKGGDGPAKTGNLLVQTAADLTVSGSSAPQQRTVTSNPICWAGDSGCSGATAQFGWKLALPDTNEQIIYNPVLEYGLLQVNTTIPTTASVLTCNASATTGFSMAIEPDTGGAPKQSFFTSAATVTSNNQVVAGLGLNIVGTTFFVTTSKGKTIGVGDTSGGGSSGTTAGPGAHFEGNVSQVTVGGRVTWVKIR